MNVLGLIIMVSIVTALVVVVECAERAKLRKLLDRPDAESLWRDCFPAASAEDIRAFLLLFTKSFAFDSEHCMKFAPEDQPLTIYFARYIPHLMVDDHFEFESLTEALMSNYKIDLKSVWKDDITLRELFAMTRNVD